jgi:hypothetical protein
MAVRVAFDDWFDAGGYDAWGPVPRFRLLGEDESSLGILLVLLSRTAETVLAGQLGLDDEAFRTGTHNNGIVRTVLRYGVRAIELGLQQGRFPLRTRVLPPRSESAPMTFQSWFGSQGSCQR